MGTLETSRTIIIFNKINKGVLYKMHVLVFIVLGSVLATTAHAAVGLEGNNNPGGVDGCTGKAIFEPNFKRGDIEKSSEEGFGKVFQIQANKKKDKVRTSYIAIEGTCCWVIEDR